MNGLAICSGIGGLELGLSLALGPSHSTVCYIEREAFPAALLVQRMEDGILDHAPIWSDLRTFDGRRWRGCVDIISAGIPCQPFSVAGKRRGIEDERWIWEDVIRIIREVGPEYIFLENVPGIVANGLGEILSTLAESGFNAEWDLFRASDVSAPHKRERWFLLADSNSERLEGYRTKRQLREVSGEKQTRRDSYNANSAFPPGPDAGPGSYPPGLEPSICRMADGISNWVDRLRSLGNAVVPGVAALAWSVLIERIHQ